MAYYPFHFVEKKVILNKLGKTARSYQLYAVTVFAVLEGSIGKNCFKMEWVLPLNYMGPNQGPYRPWYFAIHCQVLSQSIPSFPFTYDTYCPCILFWFHLFSVSFTSFTLGPQPLRCWLHCYLQLSWVTPPLFLTYQLKLFSSLLTQLSQLIRPLPPFFLGRYILATLLLGCSSLFIVMIFLDFLSISRSSSLFHLIVPAPYLMNDTA